MKRIQEHVENLLKNIPNSERKAQLRQEITQNLEEKIQDLIEQGKSEEDAINKAIVEFGDAEDIEQELCIKQIGHKRNAFFGLGFSIGGSILCISLFAFVNLYYSPKVIWFIYPTFFILWWPLATYFRWLKQKRGENYE